MKQVILFPAYLLYRLFRYLDRDILETLELHNTTLIDDILWSVVGWLALYSLMSVGSVPFLLSKGLPTSSFWALTHMYGSVITLILCYYFAQDGLSYIWKKLTYK